MQCCGIVQKMRMQNACKGMMSALEQEDWFEVQGPLLQADVAGHDD